MSTDKKIPFSPESTIKDLEIYLSNKNYKMVDITKSMNIETYTKYALLACSKPNIVLYFKRNIKNNFVFKQVQTTADCNYYFLNKDNYFHTRINKEFDNNLKRCIDGFLRNGELNTLTCEICYKDSLRAASCETCSYQTCDDCLKEITLNDLTYQEIKSKNKFVKCPQCRKDMTDYVLNIN